MHEPENVPLRQMGNDYGSARGSLAIEAETRDNQTDTIAMHYVAPLMGEFLGTFLLVFTVATVSLVNDSIQWNATACAATLTLLVASLGTVSGANLNPAVSVALGLAGKLEWLMVVAYCVVQLVAGILAGYCCIWIFDPLPLHNVQRYGRLPATLPVPKDGANNAHFTLLQMLFAEAMYTFFLCFTVLNCAASKRNNPKKDGNQFFPLAIGFVIVAAGHAIGGISGGCLNPAVALGVDCAAQLHNVNGNTMWGPAYAAVEVFGGLCAVSLFWIVRPEELKLDDPDDSEGSIQVNTVSRFVSEFLGTFFLVVTVGLNIVMQSETTAWSAAAALMCMIYSLGDVSGANFNPAVTISLVLSGRGKCAAPDGIINIMGQLTGASCAATVWAWYNYHETYVALPPPTFGLTRACMAELIFTFLLCYVVLAVATTAQTQRNQLFGLMIGSCVTAGGFAVGKVSGGELNPAVALSILAENAVQGKFNHGGDLLVAYAAVAFSEIAGGVLAAICFYVTYPQEFCIIPSLPK